jgi:hypothetical protein
VRFSSRPRLWTCAILTTLIFTGCAGATPQVSPTGTMQAFTHARSGRVAQELDSKTTRFDLDRVTTPSFMDIQAVAKPLLFVADLDSQVVDIYLQGGDNKLVGQITGLDHPYDVASDAERNLYVANYLRLGVQVYAPPYTGGPAYSLETGDHTTVDVAVSSKGVVGVSNYCTDPNCFPRSGYVTFFAPKSTTACATVPADVSVVRMEFGSFDRNGNFFTVGLDSNGNTTLGEIEGGCKAKTMTLVNAADNGALGGFHVNSSDQLSTADLNPPGSGPAVLYTFAQPTNGSLGDPVATTMLQGTGRGSLDDFTFEASGKNFYVPDSSGANVNEYAYPAGGNPEKTIGLGDGHLVFGVAASPPLLK